MAFTVPSREEVHDDIINDYASAQPTKNVSRGSDIWRLARVISGVIWLICARLLFFWKQALPDTATGWYLDRWGTVYSFPRIQPAGSAREASLQVSGTIGNAITTGAELTHADGTIYEVTSVGAVVGAGGTVDVNVEAISTGTATNKGAGEILTFTAPDAGITAAATLILPLQGGLDLEEDDPYRVRLLAHIGDPPEGGASHDYQEWALSVGGVTSAGVWAHRRGAGTMDVWALGDGTGAARVPSAAVLAAVDDLIEANRPGNVRDFLLVETLPQTQDVVCEIEIDESIYAWDWDDEGAGTVISANDDGASTITAALPAGVIAGMRLTVRGEEAMITNRVGNVLTLSFENDHDDEAVDWFTFAITDGVDEVRASGDLVRPVRFAIMDLFNTLGPARSDWAETSWIDQLKISKLYASITDVEGVDDATLTTPVANVSPTADTYGASVYFLVPGIIQVLRPA